MLEVSAVEFGITKVSCIVGAANAVVPKHLPTLELLNLAAEYSYHLGSLHFDIYPHPLQGLFGLDFVAPDIPLVSQVIKHELHHELG